MTEQLNRNNGNITAETVVSGGLKAAKHAASNRTVAIKFWMGANNDKLINFREKTINFAKLPLEDKFLFAVGFAASFEQTPERRAQNIANIVNKGLAPEDELAAEPIAELAAQAEANGYITMSGEVYALTEAAHPVLDAYRSSFSTY